MQLVVQYLTKTAIKLPSGATTAEKLEGTSTGMDAELILSPFLLHLSHLSLLFHPRFIRRLPYSPVPVAVQCACGLGKLDRLPTLPSEERTVSCKSRRRGPNQGCSGAKTRGDSVPPFFRQGGRVPPPPLFWTEIVATGYLLKHSVR